MQNEKLQFKLDTSNESDLKSENKTLREELRTAKLELEAAAVRDRESAKLTELNDRLEATVAIRDIQLTECNERIDEWTAENARINEWMDTESTARLLDEWTDTESNSDRLEATVAIRDVQLAESTARIDELTASHARLEATLAIRDVQLAKAGVGLKELTASNGVRQRKPRGAARCEFQDNNAHGNQQHGNNMMKRYLGFTEETPEPHLIFFYTIDADCSSSAGSGDDLFSIV